MEAFKESKKLDFSLGGNEKGKSGKQAQAHILFHVWLLAGRHRASQAWPPLASFKKQAQVFVIKWRHYHSQILPFVRSLTFF